MPGQVLTGDAHAAWRAAARGFACIVALILSLAQTPVFAHAFLVRAEPADGSGGAIACDAKADLQRTGPLVMRIIGPAGEVIAPASVTAEKRSSPSSRRRCAGTHG
jgi:methionine-rich copper-binding protein CopC